MSSRVAVVCMLGIVLLFRRRGGDRRSFSAARTMARAHVTVPSGRATKFWSGFLDFPTNDPTRHLGSSLRRCRAGTSNITDFFPSYGILDLGLCSWNLSCPVFKSSRAWKWVVKRTAACSSIPPAMVWVLGSCNQFWLREEVSLCGRGLQHTLQPAQQRRLIGVCQARFPRVPQR